MGHYLYMSGVGAIVIPVLLVMALFCTLPVIAADIDISIEGPGISDWAFTPGIVNTDSTNIILNVTSISSTWTVSVKDGLDYHKPYGTVGRMADWDTGTSSYNLSAGAPVLAMPMKIAGPSVPTKTTGASVILDGSNQIIESGLTPVTGLKMPLTISQPVAYTDPHLTGGHRYQVIVTYVAFAEGGPAPVVSGITPAEGIVGTTVTVTDLSGSNFLPHSQAVINRSGSTSIPLEAPGVTPTRITGTLNLAGAGVGLWDVTVLNPDGRIGTKIQAFWIKYPSAPGIGSFGPFNSGRGTTVDVGITGAGFQNGVAVKLTQGSWVIPVTVTQVTPTTIDGTIIIPPNAPTGLWALTVTNDDGQSDTIPDAFSVEVGGFAPVVEIGVFRPSTHTFYLDYNGNGIWDGAAVDRQHTFGAAGDLPITGDWNNNGIIKIGVFRPTTRMFYLDYNGNSIWDGAAVDRQYNFGLSGDIPVSGDWNNNEIIKIGVFRPSTHTFYLDYNGNGVWNGAITDRQHTFGAAGDLPITGDWNNNGIIKIGVFRPATHMFYLDYNGNGIWDGAAVDRQYNFGQSGDIPVSGDWNNNGIIKIGVFRPTTHMFYLDYNGNGTWDGAAVDRQYNFGQSGDTPITGIWG